MRIVFAGTPEVAVPTLRALDDSNHEVIGVLTRPDAPSGRGKKLHPSPVAVASEERGIPVFKPRRLDADFATVLSDLNPDIVVVVAYGLLIPDEHLGLPRHGWINLHFSLLPRWRGAAPVQRSLMAGDSITGATVFQIVSELDAGPVYHMQEYVVPADATAGSVLTTLAERTEIVLRSLDSIQAGVVPNPQPSEGITYASKITVDDAGIDWSKPAPDIVNHVRGCSPEPGAWTSYGDNRVKILSAAHVEQLPAGDPPSDMHPGVVWVSKRAVHVRCGADAAQWVQLGTVQATGKKPMPAPDWARGIHDTSGMRFQ